MCRLVFYRARPITSWWIRATMQKFWHIRSEASTLKHDWHTPGIAHLQIGIIGRSDIWRLPIIFHGINPTQRQIRDLVAILDTGVSACNHMIFARLHFSFSRPLIPFIFPHCIVPSTFDAAWVHYSTSNYCWRIIQGMQYQGQICQDIVQAREKSKKHCLAPLCMQNAEVGHKTTHLLRAPILGSSDHCSTAHSIAGNCSHLCRFCNNHWSNWHSHRPHTVQIWVCCNFQLQPRHLQNWSVKL